MDLVPLTGNSRASRRLTTSTQLSIKLSSCRHQDLVGRAPAQRCGGILFEVRGWREHPLGSVGALLAVPLIHYSLLSRDFLKTEAGEQKDLQGLSTVKSFVEGTGFSLPRGWGCPGQQKPKAWQGSPQNSGHRN